MHYSVSEFVPSFFSSAHLQTEPKGREKRVKRSGRVGEVYESPGNMSGKGHLVEQKGKENEL